MDYYYCGHDDLIYNQSVLIVYTYIYPLCLCSAWLLLENITSLVAWMI